MSSFISINFKQYANVSLLHHNNRSDNKNPPDFLNEVDRVGNDLDLDSVAKFITLRDKANKSMIDKRNGARGGIRGFKKNSRPLIDGVMALGREQVKKLINKYGVKDAQKLFREAVEVFAEKVSRETGLTFVCANGHFDEGHYKKDTELAFENFHYHITFLDYDFENKTTVMRKFRKTNPIWSKFQDLAFESFKALDFERGTKSELKHIPSQEYKALKVKAEKETMAELDSIDEQIDYLDLAQIAKLKEKHKDNKLIKRALDYAYRLKALEAKEEALEAKIKAQDYLNTTIAKLFTNDELSTDEADVIYSLIQNDLINIGNLTDTQKIEVVNKSTLTKTNSAKPKF
jgi:hypothetical protein